MVRICLLCMFIFIDLSCSPYLVLYSMSLSSLLSSPPVSSLPSLTLITLKWFTWLLPDCLLWKHPALTICILFFMLHYYCLVDCWFELVCIYELPVGKNWFICDQLMDLAVPVHPPTHTHTFTSPLWNAFLGESDDHGVGYLQLVLFSSESPAGTEAAKKGEAFWVKSWSYASCLQLLTPFFAPSRLSEEAEDHLITADLDSVVALSPKIDRLIARCHCSGSPQWKKCSLRHQRRRSPAMLTVHHEILWPKSWKSLYSWVEPLRGDVTDSPKVRSHSGKVPTMPDQ